MNDKNDLYINRKLYSFNKTRSFRTYFMEKENNKMNENIDFRRTTSACILKTDGEKPLILYLKSPKKHKHIFENKKFESQFCVNNYISDGGLKQKDNKFLYFLSKYPNNYKFHSPIKHKKQILNDLKNRKYNSLSFSHKKLAKNRTANEYKNCFEESNLYKSNKKNNKKNFINNIQNIMHDNKKNIEINSYIDNNKNKKLKNYYKMNLLKNLIKNKKFTIKIIKNKNPNLIFIERKKLILQRNGVDISNIDNTNGAQTESIYKEKEEEKNNNDKKNENNYKYKNIFQLKNNNNKEINKSKKQNYDQFEYIKKILNEHKKFTGSKPKINNFIKKDKIISYTNSKSQLHDKINIISKKYNMKNNEIEKYKNETSNEETCDEYPYSHKKNHRNIEELRVFNKLKKIKQKNKSRENELEKKRKLYIRFQNLYKLKISILRDYLIKKQNH